MNAKLSPFANNSVEFILFSLTPSTLNKTHLKKVQHLINKLSQSSFALLGNFIHELGSQFTVLGDLSSLSLLLTHLTHTPTHRTIFHPHSHQKAHYLLQHTFHSSGDSSKDSAGSLISGKYNDRMGAFHRDWFSCHWLTLKFVKTVAAQKTNLIESFLVSFPENFTSWKSIILIFTTGNKSWFSFRFIYWNTIVAKY